MNKNVPKLRFNGFEGEWKKIYLSDSVERVVRKNKGKVTNRPLTISAQYGLVDQEEFFNKLVASKNLEGYYLLNKGEFAYNKSYSNGYPFGAIKRLDKYEFGAVSTLYICFKPKLNTNSEFLTQYFESSKWHIEVSMVAVEGARNHGLLNIGVSDFFDTIHSFPSLQEQEKIANFLSNVDKIIEEQEGKVKDLELYKKGMMQKIFKQEIRFKDDNGLDYPDWEEKRLSEVFISRVEKQIPSQEAPLMAFTSTGGIEDKGDRYDRSFLVKNDMKLYKRTEMNDFIYSSNNLDVGAIGLNKYGTAVISDVYEIFIINDKYSCDFISLLIQIPRTLNKIICYRQGVMYGQYRIHANDFLKVKEFIPCLEEQEKIAKFLSNMDNIVEEENKKLEDLRQFKKGLLQQMFV